MDQDVRRRNELMNRAGIGLSYLVTGAVGLLLAAIVGYLLWNGWPRFSAGFFLQQPEDLGRAGGILPVLVSTVLLGGLSLAIAVPLGVCTAVYLTEYTAEGKLTTVIRFGAECLAGIPSIIFGLFGFILFVITLGMGWSMLAGALTLACMVLPTIIRTAEEAIKSVPAGLRDVGYSLGATKSQVVWHIVLPQARPGIMTGVILALGRALGETACVIFTTGISLEMPTSLLDPGRPMAVHFYILAREGISMEMAYTTALVLVGLILLVNVASAWFLAKRSSS